MTATALIIISTVITTIFASVTAPLILAHRTEKMHREDRLADYARQDILALRAEEAREEAHAASNALLANGKQIAAAAEQTNGKLDTIHKLVNSNLTASMEAELEAVQRELVLLLEVIELRRASGVEPSPGALALVDSTREHVARLQEQIADRKRQAEAEMENPGE